MSELKPCPFCGSPAEFIHSNGSYGYTHAKVKVGCSRSYDCWSNTILRYKIRPRSCFAETNSVETERWTEGKGTIQITKEAEAVVAALWNQRVQT